MLVTETGNFPFKTFVLLSFNLQIGCLQWKEANFNWIPYTSLIISIFSFFPVPLRLEIEIFSGSFTDRTQFETMVDLNHKSSAIQQKRKAKERDLPLVGRLRCESFDYEVITLNGPKIGDNIERTEDNRHPLSFLSSQHHPQMGEIWWWMKTFYLIFTLNIGYPLESPPPPSPPPPSPFKQPDPDSKLEQSLNDFNSK